MRIGWVYPVSILYGLAWPCRWVNKTMLDNFVVTVSRCFHSKFPVNPACWHLQTLAWKKSLLHEESTLMAWERNPLVIIIVLFPRRRCCYWFHKGLACFRKLQQYLSKVNGNIITSQLYQCWRHASFKHLHVKTLKTQEKPAFTGHKFMF